MIDPAYIELFKTVGYPTVVTLYFMFKIDKTLSQLSDVIQDNTRVLAIVDNKMGDD